MSAPDGTGARADYVEGMVGLGVWYVCHLLSTGRISARQIPDVLTRRVHLYRLTKLWDGVRDTALGHDDPQWNLIVAELAALVANRSMDGTELEARALATLRPWLSFAPEPLPPGAIGCWWYQLVGERIAESGGARRRLRHVARLLRWSLRLAGREPARKHVELHCFNAAMPHSLFADPDARRRELLELLADCQRKAPHARTLWFNSWLNARAEFSGLFPPQWRASARARTPEDVEAEWRGRVRLNTSNWWGQFQRADGSFARERARRFRAEGGVFPFPNLLCHAGIDAIMDFLRASLRERRDAVPVNHGTRP